jgi:acyl-CoA reductase-like NAD-dependent aldehyde dehydrogenase
MRRTRRAIAAAKRAFPSFSRTTKEGRLQVLRRLREAVAARVAWPLIFAGRVAINGMFDDPQAPFGRFKRSSIGREFGVPGIEAYLESRAILE